MRRLVGSRVPRDRMESPRPQHHAALPRHIQAGMQGGLGSPTTNEFQKTIWEQAKADGGRGPTNPITIQPPKK